MQQSGAGHAETFKAVATLEEMPKWQLVMQVLQVWLLSAETCWVRV